MTEPLPKADLSLKIFLMFIVAITHHATCTRLEPGIRTVSLNGSEGYAIGAVAKSMFQGTAIKLIISEDVSCKTSFTVGWELRFTRCAQLYTVKSLQLDFEYLLENPSAMFPVEPEISVIGNVSDSYQCEEKTATGVQFLPSYVTTCYVPHEVIKDHKNCEEGIIMQAASEESKDDDGEGGTENNGNEGTENNGNEGTENKGNEGTENSGNEGTENKGNEGTENKGNEGTENNGNEGNPSDGTRRRKRETKEETKTEPKEETKTEPKGGTKDDKANDKDPNADKDKNVVTLTPLTGNYLLMLNLTATGGEGKGAASIQVTIDMKGPHGYLSATQYPLLKFYGVMCGVYTLFGFTWLFLLCRQYQDLLGIQIWIGVVILLGLVEKAAFYGEFEHMNNRGTESSTGILLAELVSCVKRTLARLLVVIVSIGYGITRPRLGSDLNYIMVAGLLYMTLSSAEAIMRVSESYEHSMVAVLPLSVLEAVLVWWILRNLVDTTRTLRLRNNDTKLWLYRHFTNTLLLCIVFSVIFFIWSMKTHKFSECVQKHYELWLDDAFWHILFCVILFVVMILFRPSVNNQRYAYSPLIDEEQDDEESKEPMLSEAYDGMKMRNLKKDNPQTAVKDIADDLKWVEDNIPAAIADSALAIMDDSEEELVTNLERSKMD